MDSILNESAFLSRCKALGIVPFEADYVLRVDQDIILSSDDLGDFLSFCTENNLSSIFYNYTYDSVEDHVIDTEDLKSTCLHSLKMTGASLLCSIHILIPHIFAQFYPIFFWN